MLLHQLVTGNQLKKLQEGKEVTIKVQGKKMLVSADGNAEVEYHEDFNRYGLICECKLIK